MDERHEAGMGPSIAAIAARALAAAALVVAILAVSSRPAHGDVTAGKPTDERCASDPSHPSCKGYEPPTTTTVPAPPTTLPPVTSTTAPLPTTTAPPASAPTTAVPPASADPVAESPDGSTLGSPAPTQGTFSEPVPPSGNAGTSTQDADGANEDAGDGASSTSEVVGEGAGEVAAGDTGSEVRGLVVAPADGGELARSFPPSPPGGLGGWALAGLAAVLVAGFGLLAAAGRLALRSVPGPPPE